MSEGCINIEEYGIVIEEPNVIYKLEGRREGGVFPQAKATVTWKINGTTVARYDPWYVGSQISFADSNDPPGTEIVKTLEGLRRRFGTGEKELCVEVVPYNPSIEIC